MKTPLIALTALVAPLTTFAFTLNSSNNPSLEGWAGGEVKLMVNEANCPAGVDVPGLIADAVEVWNNVPTSSIKVSYGGATTSSTFASPPTVYCETNFQVVVGADQNYVPGAAAVTTSGGRIAQGLMYLNASAGQGNLQNFDRTILTVILAHEIGHLLGLGHSESTNALMYYDASAKTTLRLSQDDIDGISYLYPADELAGDKMAGCGLIRNRLPPTSGSRWTLLVLGLLPLLTAALVRAGTAKPVFQSAGANS